MKKSRLKKICILVLLILVLVMAGCFIFIAIKNKNNNNVEQDETNEIIDNESPIIIFKDTLETTEGTEIDLLSEVYATDNYDENITVTVQGDYDFNKKGEYTLYYVAKDSSGNETREKFVLKVNEKKKNDLINDNTNGNNVLDTTFTTSKGFSGYTKNGFTYINGYLIANKTYSLPANYNPGLNNDVQIHANEMFRDAASAGFILHLQSGFRSYSTQQRLYNNYVNSRGKEVADTFSARPGHSEHQTGLAFDVCNADVNTCINSGFDNTEDAKWLSDNCYKYGFILRYPKGKTNETGYIYESWHFRYIGDIDFATKLYNNGDWITLEDYFGITSEYNY